jgi:hypothetical protein
VWWTLRHRCDARRAMSAGAVESSGGTEGPDDRVSNAQLQRTGPRPGSLALMGDDVVTWATVAAATLAAVGIFHASWLAWKSAKALIDERRFEFYIERLLDISEAVWRGDDAQAMAGVRRNLLALPANMLPRTRQLYRVAGDASKVLELADDWRRAHADRDAFDKQRVEHIGAVIEEVYQAITTIVESAPPSVVERARSRLPPRPER